MIPILAAIAASIVIGVWAERRWPDRAGTGSRASLLVLLYAVIPPIVFFNMAHADFDSGAIIGLGLGVVTVTVVGLATWFLTVKLMHLPRPVAGAAIGCALVSNTGYLGYPVVLTIMGGDALSQGVIYDVVVSGLALFIGAFGIGAAFGTKAGEGFKQRLRSFFVKNPILYAAILGVLAPRALAPDLLVDISRVAVVAMLPIGFFAVGAVLGEEERAGAITIPPRIHRQVWAVVGTRLVLSPVLLFLISLPFSGIPHAYLLLAAMPSGLNSMVVSHAYGLDLRTTAESVVYTTALAVPVILVWSTLA